MTIAVKIENQEAMGDATKDLLIEIVREDNSVQSTEIVPAGGARVVHVHKYQHVRIGERFTDRGPR